MVTRRELLTGAALIAASAACSAAPSHAPPASTATPTATPTAAPRRTPAAVPAYAREVLHGSRTRPAVALTFHGAGDVRLAEALLREVERAGAHVTVLAVGTWLIDNPSIAARIMDGGHDLGNHTLHHRAMRTLSAAETSTEIAGCARELTRLTGSIGRWFRPSGTPRATQRILHAAAALGYRNSLAYDVDPRDYQDPSASAITNRVLDGVRAGSIVSLHLGHQNTVTALPSILDGLQQRGLRAVTTTSLLT